MLRSQQLQLDWNARPTPAVTSDPLIDSINELFAIQAFLEGDDFAQDRILKEVQDLEERWKKYLQYRIAEVLEGGK